MPKLVINPRIPNNIRILDYRTCLNSSNEEVTKWYENGDLIILSNYRFETGRKVFNKVSLPNQKGKTKLMLHLDDVMHGEPPRDQEWGSIREQLTKQDVDFEEFKEAVRIANGELLRLSDTIFPYYKYSKRFCIYNLCEMLAHNMHFDSPEHARDFTQLRVFVNLDDFPRIWRIGGSLEEMVDDCYEAAGLKDTIGQHPRTFTRKTTLATFGDRYESGAHPRPMHSIAFQPGEVWFLNPNMRAHEVVYGRRILDGVFLFEKSGLLNPERFYPAMVEQMHRKHLGRSGYWWHSWKAEFRNAFQRFRSGVRNLFE